MEKQLISQMQLIAPVVAYEQYVHAALSQHTRIAYQSDLRHFRDWGGVIPASAESICRYLAHYAGHHAPATLGRRLVSLSRAHTAQGLPSPTKSDVVKATLRGIRRTYGISQRQVSPVLKDDLFKMVEGLQGVKGCRDRALLLLGFAGAFRRSELVALLYSDIEFVQQGLFIHLQKSKTDQEGQGRKVAIPFAKGAICAVNALKDWLALSSIVEGPIFKPVTKHGRIESAALSTQAVAVLVKQRASAIGLDSVNFSGHSLRAGLVTSAAQAGVSTWKIKLQTGHKSDAMLNRYIRDAKLFIDNAAGVMF